MSITKKSYGRLEDGQAIDLFTLMNSNGIEVMIINYGGIIVSVLAPDAKGRFANIVLGHSDLNGYVEDTALPRGYCRQVLQPDFEF